MKRRIGQTACLILLICGLHSTARGDILRVQKDASGAGNGTSWADAYNELRDALNAAQPFDEIWVAAEAYSPGPTAADTFALKNEVDVYGGFLGTNHPTLPGGETQRSQRDWQNNATILSGDLGGGNNSNVIVSGNGVNGTAVLDGFTITGAVQHGIHCNGASPSLANLLVTQNTGPDGAGVLNESSSSPRTAWEKVRFCRFILDW